MFISVINWSVSISSHDSLDIVDHHKKFFRVWQFKIIEVYAGYLVSLTYPV